MTPYQDQRRGSLYHETNPITSATLLIRALEQIASFPFSSSDSDDDLESDEEDEEDEDNDYDDEIDETAGERY